MYLRRRVTVTRTDSAQVISRHAIETEYAVGAFASRDQQFVKWVPLISPLAIEAKPPPQFLLCNFAPPPGIQNWLIAGQYRFHAQQHRAALGQSLGQTSRKSL